MFWVEKNRKINNPGGGGQDYWGLASTWIIAVVKPSC